LLLMAGAVVEDGGPARSEDLEGGMKLWSLMRASATPTWLKPMAGMRRSTGGSA